MWLLVGVIISVAPGWSHVVASPSVEEMAVKMEHDREARMETRFWKSVESMQANTNAGDADEPEMSELAAGMDRMSVPPALAPKAKQIAVKRARMFMREVMVALTTEEAKTKLEEARIRGAERAHAPSPPVEPVEDEEARDSEGDVRDHASEEMLMAVGPVMDKLVRGVVLKYEFEGGFEQAMASVTDAMNRKGDQELKKAMEAIAKLLAPAKAAQIPKLGALAVKFIKMGAAEREDAIKFAESLQQESTDAQFRRGVDEYLGAMRGIVANGSSHVVETVSTFVEQTRRMEKQENRKLTSEERAAFDMRVDTLMEFLSSADQEALEDHLIAADDTKTEL